MDLRILNFLYNITNMKIITSQPSFINNISFGTIIVPKESVRLKILHSLNEKQIKILKKALTEQKNNPVNAVIDKNLFGLKAKIFCQYRLKNFVEEYNQRLFFESNTDFIHRIINKCNEYKSQLNL